MILDSIYEFWELKQLKREYKMLEQKKSENLQNLRFILSRILSSFLPASIGLLISNGTRYEASNGSYQTKYCKWNIYLV